MEVLNLLPEYKTKTLTIFKIVGVVITQEAFIITKLTANVVDNIVLFKARVRSLCAHHRQTKVQT
jgi:hypothetical protein